MSVTCENWLFTIHSAAEYHIWKRDETKKKRENFWEKSKTMTHIFNWNKWQIWKLIVCNEGNTENAIQMTQIMKTFAPKNSRLLCSFSLQSTFICNSTGERASSASDMMTPKFVLVCDFSWPNINKSVPLVCNNAVIYDSISMHFLADSNNIGMHFVRSSNTKKKKRKKKEMETFSRERNFTLSMP